MADCICKKSAIYNANGDWDCLKNEEGIVIGKYVQLVCGVDRKGFYLAATECEAEVEWHPFFCPICGRKLREPDASFKTVPERYWETIKLEEL